MAESMKGLNRSCYCGEPRESDAGKEITVCGWVQRQRDLGQLIFVDLRDRTGPGAARFRRDHRPGGL